MKGKIILVGGIESRPVWQLNHLQKPYRDCRSYKIEKSNNLWKKNAEYTVFGENK